MLYKKDIIEYQKKEEKDIELLVNEAITDKTQMDVLDNSGRCLWCPEAEAMYFKSIRDFFKNSISKRIMDINQDNSEIKVLKFTRNNKTREI